MIVLGMVVGMLMSEHGCGQHGTVPSNEGKGEVVRVDGVRQGDAIEGSEVRHRALDAKCERDNVGDVCLRAIDLDGDTEDVHGLEALLVVKPLHEEDSPAGPFPTPIPSEHVQPIRLSQCSHGLSP